MDNLDYTKIQAVFDPCSVVIAEDGVTLIFHPDKVQVSSLEIRENIQHNVREFKDLVSHAEKIRITLDPDGKGELQFCFPIPGAGTLLVSPLEHMETPEELRRELMKALSRLKPVSGPPVYTMEEVKSWSDLQKEAELLAEKWEDAIVEYRPPRGHLHFGSIGFTVFSDYREVFELPRDLTEQFKRVTHSAESIAIDSETGDGIATLIFMFASRHDRNSNEGLLKRIIA